jgi:hypothetical protein
MYKPILINCSNSKRIDFFVTFSVQIIFVHPSKYRTPKPASIAAANNTSKGIAVSAPVQRIIDFDKTTVAFKQDVTDMDSLISAAQECFPSFKKEEIIEEVNKIAELPTPWSLFQVYGRLSGLHKKLPPPAIKEETKEEVLLPRDKKHQQHYLFTQRTRLRAKIMLRRREKFLPEFTQNKKKKQHAEDQLVEHLEKMIGEPNGDVSLKSGKLIITINNSPCVVKCANTLIKLKKGHWKKGEIVIYYANPHGKIEEFHEKRKEMLKAGIKMHSFNPLAYIDSSILRPKDVEKFRNASSRRKAARKLWQKENLPDQSEASEEENNASSSTRSGNNKRKAAAAASDTEEQSEHTDEQSEDTEEQSEVSENESTSSSGTDRSSTVSSSRSTRRRKKKNKKKKKARRASPEPAAVAAPPEQGGIPEDENQFSSSHRITRSSKATAVAAASVTFIDPDERKHQPWRPPDDRKKQSASSSSSSSRRVTRSQRRAADSDGED